MPTRYRFRARGLHVLLALALVTTLSPTPTVVVAAPSPLRQSRDRPLTFDSPVSPPQPSGSASDTPAPSPLTFSSPLATPEPVAVPTAPPLRVGERVTATLAARKATTVAVDGWTTLYFPQGAVSRAAEVNVTRLAEPPTPLPANVQFKGYALDVQVRARADGKHIAQMAQPVTIVLRYAGAPGIGNAASQRLLKLYHYDEARGVWEALPTEVSPATGVLTATTSTFSPTVLGSGTGEPLGNYAEPWSPTVQDFQVSLFTGAATWQIPLDVPAGRGGLAPHLALSYNSGIVDGMRGALNPQASWVGAGWNLDTGYIVRKIELDANYVPTYTTEYHLVLNGVSSRLIPIGGEQYRTEDERFWRIQRVVTNANRGGDYWLVTTRDGTQYRFGYSDETFPEKYPNQGGTNNSAWWMVSSRCNGPGDTNLCIVNWRWNLDLIADTHGNSVRLDYQTEHNNFRFTWDKPDEPGVERYYYSDFNPCAAYGGGSECWPPGTIWHEKWMANRGYVRGGNLSQITYTWPPATGYNAVYKITFQLEPRNDYPNVLDGGSNIQSVQTFWTRYRLREIRIELNGQNETLRTYRLGYTYLPALPSGGQGMSALTSVQEFGADGSPLPPVTFGYHSGLPAYYECNTYHNNCNGTGYGHMGYGCKPWLAVVNTGYGGSIGFDYIMGGFQSGQIIDPNRQLTGQGPAGEAYRYWFRYRVRGVTANPGIGLPMRTEYQYRNADNDAAHSGDWKSVDGRGTPNPADDEYEFRGHPRVRVIRYNANGMAVAHSDHYFHQGDGQATGACAGNLQDPDGMEGREYRVVHYDAGTPLAETVTNFQRQTWGSGSNERRFIRVDAVCEYAEAGSGVSRRTEYDTDTEDGDPNNDYGNVVQVREYDSVSAATPIRTTRTAYVANASAWIVDRPTLVETFAGSVNGQKATETRTFYDRNADGSLRAWNSPPTKGAPVRVENRVNLAANEYAAADTWYDQWGNVIQKRAYGGYGVSGAAGYADPRTITTTYESTYRLFPIETCTAVGTPLRRCTQVSYYGAGDPNGLFGQVRRVTYPNSATSEFRYDRFGRLTAVKAPDDVGWAPGQVTTRYAYLDLGQVGKQRVVAWSGRDSSWQETLFDGLGRTIQTHVLAEGSLVVQDTAYNEQGRPVTVTVPYTVAAAGGSYLPPNWNALPKTVTRYDALGRVTQVLHPDATHISTRYAGRTTTVVDENGHQKRTTHDAFGRLVKVEEFSGTSPNVTLYATTVYTYDTSGNLTAVQNAAGRLIQMAYDPLGRKTAMHDPDMGAWQYGYDALGNLTRQTDARGLTIHFQYDPLNRLLIKTAGGQVLAEYGYDAGQWGIGHRTAMTDTTGVTTWAYDVRGRVISETRVLAGGLGTYTTQWRYDAADRVTAVRYPTGEVVRTSYSARGLVEGVVGYAGDGRPWVYLSGASYNAPGQPLRQTWGNGRVTTYVYHPQNVRLMQLTVGGGAGSGTPLDLRYGYDRVGNVTAITDTTRGEVQGFAYDALDRLLSVSGAYAEAYTYSATGNLTSKGGVSYGYLDAAHAHAVTHLNGAERYRYDANGNMVYRVSGGVAYQQGFDAENRLTVITNTVTGAVTRIGYDGDGARIRQTTGATTTLYLGDRVEITIAAGVRVTRTYYYAGGQRIAVRVHEGAYAPLYYLHGDHLGSAILATHGQRGALSPRVWLPLVARNADGSTPPPEANDPPPLRPGGPVYLSPPDAPAPGTVVAGSETRYRPYGEVRTAGRPVAGLTARTYTGQAADEATGLMFYNARWYDPALGRFISADPIVPNHGDPQGLNRYSYARNSPCRYIDPSGHCWGAFGFVRGLPSYDTTCNNLDMALIIARSDQTTAGQKAGAVAYIAGEGIGHGLLVVGAAMLVWKGAAVAYGAANTGLLELAAAHPVLAKVLGLGGAVATRELADTDNDEARIAEQAVEAARRLREVGLDSAEAEGLIRTITDASTRGPAVKNGVTVLGHYPDYIDRAQEMGATYLSMPKGVWEALGSDSLRWAVNQRFIDDAITRGDTFVFASVLRNAGSFFARELKYLSSLILGNPTIHPQP